MNFPITGDRTFDFALVVILVIIGVGLAVKADQWWGWLLVAFAGYWGYQLVSVFM